MPRIVEPTSKWIAAAADALQRGEIAAFPTETVYGLGADTFNADALNRVFALKGRPLDNPLIAHVLDAAQARTVAARWDDRCEVLAARFWPGPLTLVMPRASAVPDRATAGYTTIALRSPAHPVARALLERFGGPISAPSANRSGHVSPTAAEHVAADFAEAADLLILDGGPCAVGIESTVLDLSGAEPHVLRPGSITAEQIADALGQSVTSPSATEQSHSPGTATSHYAPRTPLTLASADEIESLLATASGRIVLLNLGERTAAQPHRVIALPMDAQQYAARLYGALREADEANAERIVVQWPTEPGGVWDAVRDRLSRAAH